MPRDPTDKIYLRQLADYCADSLHFREDIYYDKIRFSKGRGRAPGVMFFATSEDRHKLARFLRGNGYLEFTSCRVWQRGFDTPKAGEVFLCANGIQIRCGKYIIFECDS